MATETDKSVNELLAEWEAERRPTEPEQQADEQAGLESAESDQSPEEQPELTEWEKTKQRVMELGMEETISGYESELGELRSELEARDSAELSRVQHEAWDKAVDSLIQMGVNVDTEVLKNATLGEYLANEDFRDAFDNRADDPQAWRDAIEAMGERLPRQDGGLRAAVRYAATVATTSNGGEYDGVEWGKLTDSEFAEMKQKVFADSASGKLQQSERGWGKFA